MNIVTISSLYPNNKDPKHGIFVETRLRHLVEHYPEVKPIVIAPVPWFPFSHKVFGEYAKYAGVKSCEERHGITVYHPRYLVLPKIGMYLTPKLMERAIKRSLKQLIAKGQQVDVIDGHYFFPDGVAIANAAEALNLPFTCTARGTDINLIPQFSKAKKMIQEVFSRASHLMAVCHALSSEMVNVGATPEKVTTLRNGVDLTLFAPSTEDEQQALKASLGVESQLVMSVGWLIERKGHHLVIEALLTCPNVVLAIAGDGPNEASLKALVDKLGLNDRVKFLGALSQPELSQWFRAADATVLASSREGWANVLLESMASGTPVVATNVWGTPEVVACFDAGELVERNSESISQGLQMVLTNKRSRAATRVYAEQFDWQSTSDGQMDIFKSIVTQE